jgi:hypothetical protein
MKSPTGFRELLGRFLKLSVRFLERRSGPSHKFYRMYFERNSVY